MYKIAILGCENSHADAFLKFIYGERKEDRASYVKFSEPVVNDIEVIGVYSDEEAPMEKLNKMFGVPKMSSYDELVGKVDGIIVTARHGDNHYKYAKPYIASGIPMFIDKPITISEEEAVKFMNELKENNVKVVGGSVCGLYETIKKYKKIVENKEMGEVYGGAIRAPMDAQSTYGGFFFYSQHLVQMMCEIFGYYPKSVTAVKHEKFYNCLFNYEDVDVKGTYVNGNYRYFALTVQTAAFRNPVNSVRHSRMNSCSTTQFSPAAKCTRAMKTFSHPYLFSMQLSALMKTAVNAKRLRLLQTLTD